VPASKPNVPPTEKQKTRKRFGWIILQ